MPLSESLIMQAKRGEAEPFTILQDISGRYRTPMEAGAPGETNFELFT
jgi:hypothetical protein